MDCSASQAVWLRWVATYLVSWNSDLSISCSHVVPSCFSTLLMERLGKEVGCFLLGEITMCHRKPSSMR